MGKIKAHILLLLYPAHAFKEVKHTKKQTLWKRGVDIKEKYESGRQCLRGSVIYIFVCALVCM